MKSFFLVFALFLTSTTLSAQKNKGLCKVEVNDVSNVTSFGYLVSYSVQFKNNTNKSVDGIYWKANYYNNANVLLSSDESSFNSSSMIDPIASGVTKTLIRTPKLKGASKVIIVITSIHFVDNTSCK
jgi:hypothetical protein